MKVVVDEGGRIEVPPCVREQLGVIWIMPIRRPRWSISAASGIYFPLLKWK
jgi:hypothetical protein